MKPFFDPEPIIFAKQGGIPDLQKNSIAACKKAIEAGADVIATKITLNQDKKIELADNDFKTNEIILSGISLEELLEEFPEQRFNIELLGKDLELTNIFCDFIEKTNSQNKILATSMHGKNIKLIRSRLPDIATSFSLIGIIGVYALFRTGLLNFKKKFKADSLQVPEVIGPSFIANQGMIRMAKERGLRIHVFVDNTEYQIKRLCEAEVDGFFSDDVIELKKILDKVNEF